MSASRVNMFVVPWSYRGYRALTLAVFVLILLLAGLGAVGRGPASQLHKPTDQAVTWVKAAMGVTEPLSKRPPSKKPVSKKPPSKKPASTKPASTKPAN